MDTRLRDEAGNVNRLNADELLRGTGAMRTVGTIAIISVSLAAVAGLRQETLRRNRSGSQDLSLETGHLGSG